MTNIAICAPATPITREHSQALEVLVAAEFPGHRVTFHEQCFERAGHFAGDDLRRLTALLDCANDPAFDAVWFAKGGYGSNRIAEAAVAQMNRHARAKTYVGFSDAGYLLAALYRATAPVSDALQNALMGGRPWYEFMGAGDAERIAAALAAVADALTKGEGK